jgi:hypothetical protein
VLVRLIGATLGAIDSVELHAVLPSSLARKASGACLHWVVKDQQMYAVWQERDGSRVDGGQGEALRGTHVSAANKSRAHRDQAPRSSIVSGYVVLAVEAAEHRRQLASWAEDDACGFVSLAGTCASAPA